MSLMGATELLSAWEKMLYQTVILRPLELLATVEDLPLEQLAYLSIGQRDERLLAIREAIFGGAVSAVARCPKCQEYVELDFNIADIRTEPAANTEPLVVEVEGYEVAFRLPNSFDLNAVCRLNDVARVRQALLECCVLEVAKEGAASSLTELPVSVLELVTQRMADADPQAEVAVDLTCPTCEYNWLAQFDIASFLWSEINAWALRFLREVHLLAGYYSWREADILNMSALRRQLYLQMMGAL